MRTDPFPLFHQFRDRVSVHLLPKEDACGSDARATTFLHLSKYASLQQVHGNRTIVVNEESHSTEQADGMLTDTRGLSLILRTADCQSFALYAPTVGVLGVLHAGWRGLVAGAIEHQMQALQKHWKINPADVFVAAGPSLCTECAEFSDPTRELPGIPPEFFHERHVDLRGIADHKLFTLGILPEHFERHPDCTRCKSDTYYSYRGGDKEAVLSGLSNYLVCTLR